MVSSYLRCPQVQAHTPRFHMPVLPCLGLCIIPLHPHERFQAFLDRSFLPCSPPVHFQDQGGLLVLPLFSRHCSRSRLSISHSDPCSSIPAGPPTTWAWHLSCCQSLPFWYRAPSIYCIPHSALGSSPLPFLRPSSHILSRGPVIVPIINAEACSETLDNLFQVLPLNSGKVTSHDFCTTSYPPLIRLAKTQTPLQN